MNAVADASDGAATPDETLPQFSRAQLEAMFFEAARLDRVDLVDGLIEAGLPPDLRDDRHYPALVVAAYHGSCAVSALLIDRGAPVDQRDAKGSTALMGVAFKGDLAAAELLIGRGAVVDAANEAGQTALMMAALFGRTEMVRRLLRAGADPDQRDNSGKSARDLVRAQGNAGIGEVFGDAI